MHRFHILVNILLLFTVPSIPLYSEYTFSKILFPYNVPSAPLSYNDFLYLFEQIESGEIEKKCTSEEMEEIAQFLAFLLRTGVLDESFESQLETDIEELLGGEEESFGDLLSFAELGKHQHMLIPSAVYKPATLIPCKSKFFHSIVKTVKKHKKELIVAAIIVVAVTATVVTVGSLSAVGAGAVAAGIAGVGTNSGNHSNDSKISSSISKTNVDQQVSSLKKTIIEEGLLSVEKPAFEERGRAVGSAFAHNILNQSGKQEIPYHFRVDEQFNTSYPYFYNTQLKETNFSVQAHQALGENALIQGRYREAVNELDKVIAIEPSNSIAYLDRGIACLGLNEFEQALEDYHEYLLEISPQSFPVEEFSIGLMKELPTAIYHSGKNIAFFASDLLCHPIYTGTQMIQAISQLSELARNGEWGVIAEVMVPEAAQLVKEWSDLSVNDQARRAGAVLGQYGSDIFLSGALVKAASRGMKMAEELAVVSKRLQATKKTLVFETVVAAEEGAKIAEIVRLESRISEWLGEGARLIRNEAGDPIFLSKDGFRRVRFDFNRPTPHNSPHSHIEYKLNGVWEDSGQIYPIDVPHN